LPAILLALGPLFCSVAGESRPLDTCVPAEAMAAYFARPTPEMLNLPPGGTLDQLAGWLVTFKAMGIIPRQGRVVADLIATLPMLARRPHALVLLDITSKRIRLDVYRLKDMQAALLIDGEGLSLDIDRRIRDLLATYTDPDNGRVQVVHRGGIRYHRLTDRRLPDWATVEWGEIGKQFLVTFGQGAFQTMLDALLGRARVLADDEWFRRAHALCQGATSGIEVFIDPVRIQNRVGQVVKDRPGQVLRALGMERAHRLVWTVGFDGRALRSEVFTRDLDGEDHYAMLTGKEVTPPEVTAAIPPAASSYAAFRFPLPEAVRGARTAYLQSQSAGACRRLLQGWDRIEREFDFDAETGLIDQLGENLVLHTFPPHPLRLPILCTIWIQFTGDRPAVTRTVDRMMTAWQTYAGIPTGTRPAVGLLPRIHRDTDGIWHLQLGLIAPAVGVADGWIVISFSPEAVRANLAHLQTLAGQSGRYAPGQPPAGAGNGSNRSSFP